MLYVTLANGSEIQVFFRHDKKDRSAFSKEGMAIVQRHPFKTTCGITTKTKILGEGVAICDDRDNFVYEVGRKIALSRALMASDLSADDRTEVWAAYFNQKEPDVYY